MSERVNHKQVMRMIGVDIKDAEEWIDAIIKMSEGYPATLTRAKLAKDALQRARKQLTKYCEKRWKTF